MNYPNVALHELAEIVVGKTPSRSVPQYWAGEHAWLSISDMKQGRVILKTREGITDAAVKLARPKLIPIGTVLLSFKLSIGKVAIAGRPLYTNEAIAALPIRDPSRLDSHFLARALEYLDLAQGSNRAAMGATLNRPMLEAIPVPLPPLRAQRRIAQTLDEVDELRQSCRRVLTLLDELADALFMDMFAGLINDFKSESYSTLGDLISFERPLTYGILMPGPDFPGGVPYIRVTDMVNGRISEEMVRHTTPEISASYKRSVLRAGDLLISIRGHVGRTAIVSEAMTGANITQDSARIALLEADARYVAAWISTPEATRWLGKHTKGVAVRGINLGDLRRMPIPLPSREAQSRFAAACKQLDKSRDLHTMQLAGLDEIFTSLQDRAFKGEL